MSQLADANDDFARMVRIAVAHLDRAKHSAPSEWARGMVDTAAFNARRVLPDHVSKYEQTLRTREEESA